MVKSSPLRAIRRLLPTAALLLGLAGPVHAQGTAEQREACTPDALKLCSDTIPDVAKTTACMKLHEAALSPRCRAVFNETDPNATRVSSARPQIEDTQRRHGQHRASATEEREDTLSRPRHRQQTLDTYDEGSRDEGSRPRDGDGFDTEEQQVTRGGPADDYGGPSIRHFAPGDGPDEMDAGSGGPAYGYDQYDGGPSYRGPREWDGFRFADRGPPDDYGSPGPDRYDGPTGPGEPPEHRRGGYGARAEDGPPPRRARRRAQAVIARFCAAGEIDPRTCALTERALQQRRRD